MRRSLQILFVLAVSLVIVPVAVLGQANNPNTDQRRWGKSPNATAPARPGWGSHPATAPNTAAPAGWARGRKVGWHGNNVPPGQVRNDPYEHHYRHHHRRHHRRDWDRDHHHFRQHHDHDRH